jgi:integrase
LAVTVAVQMVRRGQLRFGVGTLLAFDCLLRVGELAALRHEDIAFPGDARLGAEYRVSTVSIRKAKTGRNQSVTIRESCVADLVRDVVKATKPGQPLFPGGAKAFRRAFKETCAELGISDRYVPHSLRHGGATRLSLLGWKVEDILLRGRWESNKSARIYVKSGRAMLMAIQVPKRIGELAAVLAADPKASISLAQKH